MTPAIPLSLAPGRPGIDLHVRPMTGHSLSPADPAPPNPGAGSPRPKRAIIRAFQAEELQIRIDEAVRQAISEGLQDPSQVILVTRHHDHLVTVELPHEVPSRTVAQRDLRRGKHL